MSGRSDLLIEMLECIRLLGVSATARVDARVWHKHFARRVSLQKDRQEERNPACCGQEPGQ
jgi:hypothetical protein